MAEDRPTNDDGNPIDVPVYTPVDFALPETQYSAGDPINLGLVIFAAAPQGIRGHRRELAGDRHFVEIRFFDGSGTDVSRFFDPAGDSKKFNHGLGKKAPWKHISFIVLASAPKGTYEIRAFNQEVTSAASSDTFEVV